MAATVLSLIESISTQVISFGIRTVQENKPPRKTHNPSKSAIKTEAPRVIKQPVAPNYALTEKPQMNKTP